jgi:glucose/arabinose dehydrogenase
VALLAAVLALGPAQAQTYTNAFPGLTFARPLWMEEIPGKPGHFMVLEQGGTVQVVTQANNAWTKTEFVKITVVFGGSSGSEDGLLGFAFHPEYATNRKYYLYYNGGTSASRLNVLEERVADATLLKDGGTAPKTLLSIADNAPNHNGGTIRFRKDGFLYLGTGDGGSQNDPNGNGQNKNALLAKMLRIDVNKQENGKNYGIPADNPFATSGGAPEVYAYGLRNPYKWAFDPVTDDFWVADVGQGAMEEVDLLEKGGNYGWKVSEGFNGVTGDIKKPVWAYPRTNAQNPTMYGTSVIGGYVFRGNPASKFYGQYIFGDYTTPYNMWAVAKPAAGVDTGKVTPLNRPTADPRGWGTDNAGNLYLMAGTTTIYRLTGADFEAATSTFIPRDGNLARSIGCIFACKPGARLDAKAFGEAAALEIHDLAGARVGRLDRDAAMPGLKAGLYILRSGAGAAPNLLMIR